MPKIVFICDKNERTSFGRLTMNLLDAVCGKFDAHVLWLKTPKFFPDEVNAEKSAKMSAVRNSDSWSPWQNRHARLLNR